MHSVNANLNQTLADLANQPQTESDRILDELLAEAETTQQDQPQPAATVPVEPDNARHADNAPDSNSQLEPVKQPSEDEDSNDAAGLVGVGLWAKLAREGQPRLTPVDPHRPKRPTKEKTDQSKH